MSFVAAAIVGSTVVSGVIQSKAAKKASGQQAAAADKGMDEQRRQFDALQLLMKPYVATGATALGQQAALIGAGGAEAQRAAINALQQGPEFNALVRQGEESILQNAAATGGLRGGNVQGALAQFRPQVLSSLIEQQYNRLGGLSSMGQNAAAGVGNAGMQTGNNISNLLAQQGAAQAGGTLAAGQAWGNTIGSLAGGLGRGMAYQGYTPQGATAPLTFGQAMLGGF
jgi:curli biogenesis system outer membrane secretion channel CsgG